MFKNDIFAILDIYDTVVVTSLAKVLQLNRLIIFDVLSSFVYHLA